MSHRRLRLDADTHRHGRVVVGGSPLKLFRLTDRGARIVERIEHGGEVDESPLVRSLLDAGAAHPVPAAAADAFTEADVTVVVPALGRPEHLPPGAILVDDGSEPPLEGADVRLDVNAGPGAARNAGLDRVETPLVAFVDADVRVDAGWLAGLLPDFDDVRGALGAPGVRSAAGSAGAVLAGYEADHSPLDLGGSAARVRPGSRVSYVPAAAIVCRTDAVRSVGGFDGDLRFGEDVDLVWRLDAAGWWVRYEPDTIVEHEVRPTWVAWARQRVGYGSSAAPLSRRHDGALAPVRMSGWSLAAWTAGVALHPALGVVVAAGSSAALVRKLDDLPPAFAFGLAWRGTMHAGEQLGAAIRRVWWPLLAVAAIRSRCARRVLVLAALTRRHPIGIVDDLAYSVGVWRGIVAERTAAPLVPEIGSWPDRGGGRRRAKRLPIPRRPSER